MTAVLFTCAGQRVDIVTAFKRAGARTVAADVNRLAPALYHADAHASMAKRQCQLPVAHVGLLRPLHD